ncbi:hypothetical protein [Reyranella sp.]|uniref:hypothetical protein n=1 Tax=Reyranella sp. TaxID=1929291 RepID=UPI003F720232
MFADSGWIRGQRWQDYVNARLGSDSSEQMPRHLIVAATRWDDKTPVFFRSGNTGVAVRASSAMSTIITHPRGATLRLAGRTLRE